MDVYPENNIFPISSLVASENNIFAGTNGGGIFLSTNNGQNWDTVNIESDWIFCLAINGNNIFAGTPESIYLSTNNGQNWNKIGLEDKYIEDIAISENNIFALDIQGGNDTIFLSTNNGISWMPITNGLPMGIGFSCITTNGNNIFAGTGVGVYLSTDNGQNWSSIGLANNSVTSLIIQGTNIFAGTTDGIFLSKNNGINWINISQGFSDIWKGYSGIWIRSLMINSDIMYAGTWDNGVWKRSVTEMLTICDNMYATATSITNESTVAASDGAINIEVYNGATPYTYSWSNGATTQNISGLSAGYYHVTVTDSNTCQTTATFEVLCDQIPWECNDTLIELFSNPIDTCFDVEPDEGYIYSFNFPTDSTVEITWILLSTTDTSFVGYLTELYQFDTAGCYVAILEIECNKKKALKHLSDNIHIDPAFFQEINEPVNTIEGCKAYPNPVKDELYISFNMAKNATVTVNIFNSMGQVVENIQGSCTSGMQLLTLNTSDLSSGLYIVQILTGKDQKMLKILK